MQSNLSKILLSLIDLTSLNESDTDESITMLCQKAQSSHGHVAAVCVYPQFVKLCAQQLSGTSIQIATVVNFPDGSDSLEATTRVIEQAIQDGAHEIDLVFPYKRYLAGEELAAVEFIKQCRQINETICLKVILETGAFPDVQRVGTASQDILLAGADFIKTSTGKTSVGATLPAATTMLMAIKAVSSQLNRPAGLKVSGGVRTLEQAVQYYSLVNEMMGPDWISPRTFRIGASQLVDELIKSITH